MFKLFAYWHTPEFPNLIKKCLENWKTINNNFEVIPCHPQNINNYIGEYRPIGFSRLSVVHQSDWIRLKLISLHGGVYCDASTLFLNNILEWCNLSADLNGFMSFDQRIYNFFIACFNSLELVNLWLEESTRAVETGIEEYTKITCSQLKQNIKSYFWSQIALLKVLNDSQKKYHLNLFYNQNILPSINQIVACPKDNFSKLVKLNHHKRDWLDIYLTQNKDTVINKDSILYYLRDLMNQ